MYGNHTSGSFTRAEGPPRAGGEPLRQARTGRRGGRRGGALVSGSTRRVRFPCPREKKDKAPHLSTGVVLRTPERTWPQSRPGDFYPVFPFSAAPLCACYCSGAAQTKLVHLGGTTGEGCQGAASRKAFRAPGEKRARRAGPGEGGPSSARNLSRLRLSFGARDDKAYTEYGSFHNMPFSFFFLLQSEKREAKPVDSAAGMRGLELAFPKGRVCVVSPNASLLPWLRG